MKITSVILLALLAVGCLTSGISYPTVGEAFDATFLGVKSRSQKRFAQHLGSSPIRVLTLSSTDEKLQDSLVSQKVSEKLAALIVASIQQNLKDTYIRTTGIVTSEESETTTQKAVCVYRTGKSEGNDFFCIIGSIKHKGTLTEQYKKLADQIESTMKTFAEKIPTRLRNLHAFNGKGFEILRSLGTAESQAKLTEFLNESAKNKDTAYAELRKNQNDPFVAKLFKNGVTHFTSSASVESLEGVEQFMFEDYYNHLIAKMQIPPSTQEDFRMEMRLATMGSRGEWKSVDFLFKNSRATAKYVNVMCAYDDRVDEADFLIADVQASFELGPDVIVTTSTKSSFFGLFSKTQIKYIYRPAELTEKSIQLIFEFFKLAALEKFTAFRRGG